MIDSCSCSKRKKSPLEIFRPQEVLQSFKSSGGRSIVKECLSLPPNMVGTIGREHSGALACNLTWVISTKNNSRAPRRRKSFPLAIGKDATENVWQVSDDFMSTNGEMSVVESEKLGVTILGRRFGEPIQRVPIKKRRFLQLQPISSPSPLCFAEQTHCLSACKDRKMRRLNEKKPFQGMNLDKSGIRRTTGHTSNLRREHSKPGEGADFSGILILAAAACDSGLAGDDIMISLEQENDVSKSNIQKDAPNSVEEYKFVIPSIDVTGCTTVLSASEVAMSAVSKEGDQTKIRELDAIEHHLNDCSKVLLSSSDSLPRSSLREDKFCWDLNKAVDDAWEDLELDFVESQNPSAYDSIKNDVCATQSNKQKTCLAQGDDDGVQCPSKLHDDIYSDKKLKDSEMYNDFDGSGKKLVSHDCNNVIDHGSESQGLSVVFADDSAQNNCHVSDDATRITGEREVSSNADDSLASGVISPDHFMVSSFNAPVADAEGLHVEKISSHYVTEWSQDVGFLASRAGTLVDSSDSEKVFYTSNGCVVDEKNKTVSKTTTLCVSETIIKSPCKLESPLVSRDMGIQESGGSTDLNVQLESFIQPKNKLVQCSALHPNSNPDVECLQKESGSKVCAGAEERLEAVDATVKTSKEYAPERLVGWHSTSFNNDKERHIELEKMEIQEDDDSQYEDGEFRVSHDWGLDECDDEAEHVDYGSDDNDTIASESSPDHFTSTVSPHLDTAELKLQKPLVQEDIRADAAAQVSKCLMETGLRHYQNSDVETGKRTCVLDRARRICESRDEREVSLRRRIFTKQSDADGKANFDSGHFVVGNNAAKESSRSTFLKMKSSGWDQLPERSRQNRNAAGDDRSAGCRKTQTISPDEYASIESCGRVGLKQITDPSSQLDCSNRSEISCKADAGYFWRKRDYPDDPNHTIQRNETCVTSVIKDGSSACWDGFRTKNKHNFSPGHHSSRFSQPRVKNTAEFPPLKVVNIGFVAPHDETVVDPTDCEFNSQAIGCNEITSMQDAQHPPKERISPTGRDEGSNFDRPTDIGLVRDTSPASRANISCCKPGKYEPRIITTGHGQRYLGPISDDDIDSMLPTQHSFSGKCRKFSPRRNSLHMPKFQARSRSRSWSRTHSPHSLRSPRRKTDSEMNGSRQWSRSPPNFRINRGEQTRMPLRPGFYDEMIEFAPTRSHVSPPLPSRWINERKDLRRPSREHEYRCSARRSTSERFFPEDRRIFVENIRLKTEDYRKSSNPGRFREFSIDKRSRFDASTDGRGYQNRYERLRSPSGRHGIVGDDKHLNYDDHGSFRSRISRHRVGQEFDGRGSQRDLDDDLEKQIRGPSCRPRDGGSHHFRYDRDLQQDRSFRSFEIQECDDDMTVRRRLP